MAQHIHIWAPAPSRAKYPLAIAKPRYIGGELDYYWFGSGKPRGYGQPMSPESVEAALARHRAAGARIEYVTVED